MEKMGSSRSYRVVIAFDVWFRLITFILQTPIDKLIAKKWT
jgi:hypothetical protein